MLLKMIIALVLLISSVKSSWGQLCSVQREVYIVILSPQSFFGSTPIFPGTKGCTITQLVNDPNAISCSESILFDDDHGPRTFNLDDSRTLSRFVGWTSESYMMFDMGAVTTITAIDISVVNFPHRNVGLPNIQIYSSDVLINNISPIDSRATVILYDYLQNEHLSKSDQTVRVVTLRPRTELSTRYLLLRWTFTGLALEHFALSEIRFCGDSQPKTMPQPIWFQTPIEGTTNILPRAKDFQRNRPLILTCTVANSGSFTWQWTSNGQPVSKSDNIEIVVADGTRTTTLTILNPSSRNGNVAYFCQVSTNLQPSLGAARQFVTLPLILRITKDMPGIITCEAYGYIEDINSEITWTFNGNALSSNFSVRVTSGSNQLVSFDRRSRNSIISILEIPDLKVDIQGFYECSIESHSKLRPVKVKTTPGSVSSIPTTAPTIMTMAATLRTNNVRSTTPTSESTILFTIALSLTGTILVLLAVVVMLFYTKRHRIPIFNDFFRTALSVPATSSATSIATSSATSIATPSRSENNITII